MRHRLSGRQLNRDATARASLFNNLVTSLITYGRIETTVAKAKELGRYVEPVITLGVGVHSLVAKGDKATPAETAKIVHAMRMARKTVTTRDAVHKLFHEVAPHFAARKGGYTRVLKTRTRKGDAAPMAFIELVGLNGQPTATA